jgi:hypothetical protein
LQGVAFADGAGPNATMNAIAAVDTTHSEVLRTIADKCHTFRGETSH